MNHWLISTEIICSWKKGKKKKSSRGGSTDGAAPLTMCRLSFPQPNRSLLLCKASHAACQLDFSVVLFGLTKKCGGLVTRHPSLCSGAFRSPENWHYAGRRNLHANGSLYLNVINDYLVLLYFRSHFRWLNVRSESCKQVVEITQSDCEVKFTVVFEMPEQHVSSQRICR